MRAPLRQPGRFPRGAAAVEFALVSTVFLLLLIGIIEWGRVLFYWNTAVEGTRAAARTAVVCDLDAGAIKRRITTLLPQVAPESISVHYLPENCSATALPNLCETVTVSLAPNSVVIDTFIPFVSFSSITMPSFTTTLTTESLQSQPGGVGNPSCSP